MQMTRDWSVCTEVKWLRRKSWGARDTDRVIPRHYTLLLWLTWSVAQPSFADSEKMTWPSLSDTLLTKDW